MQRLVVRAVDADELVQVLVAPELVHLRLEPRPADRGHQRLVGNLPPEHRLRGVPHRGEDDPAGVDDGAVEIEEDDRKAHAPDRSRATRRDPKPVSS